MEVISAISGIALLLLIYIGLNIICERYLGFNILFYTTHRGAKRANNENFNLKLAVDKFATENPKIYSEITKTLKRKRYRLTYNNLDYLIRQYIGKNPSWADEEYQLALAKYNLEEDNKNKKNLEEEYSKRIKLTDELISTGYSKAEADEFISSNNFLVSVASLQKSPPKKKVY